MLHTTGFRPVHELGTHYLQNLTQWNRYAEHAAAAVGGSWTHHKRYGEDGWVYTPIPPDYQELALQRLLNHARLARMIEHEAFLGEKTYRPADMLDGARTMVWREVGQRRAADTYRRNLQRAYLAQAHHLLHEATSPHWTPPDSGNLHVTSNDDPPLNADLHVAQSDIRPLIRDQLRLLRGELREALAAGIADRMTRIHYEDALERIARAIGS